MLRVRLNLFVLLRKTLVVFLFVEFVVCLRLMSLSVVWLFFVFVPRPCVFLFDALLLVREAHLKQ